MPGHRGGNEGERSQDEEDFPNPLLSISFPDTGRASEKQTETTSPSSSRWGSGVLFFPGLSAQLDEQQQGGKNSWQLKWGKKETLNQHEASLEPKFNTEIHRDLERSGQGVTDSRGTLRASVEAVWTVTTINLIRR